MKSERRWSTLITVYRVFLGLAILEGALALWNSFRIPSETRRSLFLSFSVQRLAIGFAILLVMGIFIFLLIDSLRSQKFLKILTVRIEAILRIDLSHILIKTALGIIILASSMAVILFFPLPYLQRFLFFILPNNVYAVLGERFGFLAIWILLISLKVLILYSISGRKASSNLAIPVQMMVVSWGFAIFYLGLFAVWSLLSRRISPELFIGPGYKVLVLCIWFSFWAFLNNRFKEWTDRFLNTFICISIGLFFFFVSMQFAQWFYAWGSNVDDNFVLLAYSFLHGKLYLINEPSVNHDLIFFNQHWFVAFPPFPVLLMLPFVAIWGIEAFNLTAFSLVLGSLAVVMMYLIPDQLIRLGWVKLSRSGAIWLTALFAFGTVFWWLSILGTTGFLSQVVTVLLCELAFLSALKKYSPLVPGLCLALAIMTRPNVFVLWPALLAITIQINLKDKKVNWKSIFYWGGMSVIPVIICTGLLLLYNYLRFGDFLDFGYASLNGASWILPNVQKYGIFNLHYVPFNLYSMFLALPQLSAQCTYYLPRGYGMSILMTTPAILYVLRKFKISWWTGGCWLSILFSIALLAMYSNNGANQYGYRYVMDFIVPIIMLIAYNAGEKVSGLLKTLILASIIINYYGTISWLKTPCAMVY